ncbi:hypothetical protein D3P09_16525 [Paenibacillus pinisoli]|uniref:Uncharacterized protein n=1 Tax=Paenibacillus pinisoli TaxID=1276110 RepID=A0A3A6PIX5_9BACL|nr:hypothetical protein [Paenibacillus pinisoli]RJX39098.1 hypothetical protein D3P09_16525 [Paenibacillus pinisoli]
MKNRSILTILLMIVCAVLIADRLTFTSFQKQVLKPLEDNEPIKITVNRISDLARLTIRDEQTMQSILGDLANTKLWKVKSTPSIGDIHLRIYHADGRSIDLDITADKRYVTITEHPIHTSYKVLKNDGDYLKTIETLEWEYPE